jgi:hypothetical protein
MAAAPASAYCHKSTCNPTKQSCAVDKYGCVSSGYGYVWSSLPIPYRFSSAGSSHFDDAEEMRDVVRRAFQKWEDVDCAHGPTSLSFSEGADTDSEPAAGKPAPRDFGIYFRDDAWPDNDTTALALTRQDSYLETGQISGASIEVNTAEKTFRLSPDDDGEFDLEAVLTHEVGHYLGLDHSKEPGAIMAPYYCENTKPCLKSTDELRALGADDIAGVCRLYPPAGASPPSKPTATCSLARTEAPLWPWAAFPLIAWLRRRSLRASACSARAPSAPPSSTGCS